MGRTSALKQPGNPNNCSPFLCFQGNSSENTSETWNHSAFVLLHLRFFKHRVCVFSFLVQSLGQPPHCTYLSDFNYLGGLPPSIWLQFLRNFLSLQHGVSNRRKTVAFQWMKIKRRQNILYKDGFWMLRATEVCRWIRVSLPNLKAWYLHRSPAAYVMTHKLLPNLNHLS